MRKLYVSFPKRMEKVEIVLIRVPPKKRQKKIKFSYNKEEE